MTFSQYRYRLGAMNNADSYFAALEDALRRGDDDFARRLVSEAANDTFSDEAPTLSPTGEIASMLKVAMAFSFATRGIAIPAWANIRPLLRPTFLLPEYVLDDAWRAEIRAQTPEVFAMKNIFIAERDLVIA